MIDWENERVIPLRDVPKYVQSRCSGKRVAPATVWRWAMKKNNPLETFSQGGGRFTSLEAIGRFIQHCSTSNTMPVPMVSGDRAKRAGEQLRRLVGGSTR